MTCPVVYHHSHHQLTMDYDGEFKSFSNQISIILSITSWVHSTRVINQLHGKLCQEQFVISCLVMSLAGRLMINQSSETSVRLWTRFVFKHLHF